MDIGLQYPHEGQVPAYAVGCEGHLSIKSNFDDASRTWQHTFMSWRPYRMYYC